MNNIATSNNDMRITELDEEQEAQRAIAVFCDFVGFSSINGDPFGYEEMPPESYKSIKWASSKHNCLSENEYACLLDYYTLAYEGFTSSNEVQKFKSIDLLGYSYSSQLTGSNSGVYVNAFRKKGTEIDFMLDEITLRTGAIRFFFRHAPLLEDENGEAPQKLDHYFAFVQWFKLPREGIEDLQSYTDDSMQPFIDQFEEDDFFCIVPVHKIHSTSHLYYPGIANIVVALHLPRKIR